MSTQEKRHFSKHVAIKAINEEEQTATGIVLTPYELDHQLDFVYPDGVGAMYNPDPDDGVLHARFPDDAAELEFNEVLDEDQEIDGVQFEAGDWVVRRKYHDDELWSFVGEVLHGFSIGGDVTEADEFDSIDDLPDEVEIPDSVDPDAVDDKYWPLAGIRNGATTEISDVDIPAVTSAVYATKSAGGSLEKNLYENADDREDFIETMSRRGAPEDTAGELWDYLEQLEKTAPDGAVAKFFADAEKAGEIIDSQSQQPDMEDSNTPDDEPDDATKWRKFKSWLKGSDSDAADADDGVSPADGQSEVSAGTLSKAIDVARDVSKEGRTLNAQNREALMAAHDAIEAALESELDFEANRFTDDDKTDFDIAQFGDSGDSSDGEEGTEKSRPIEKLTEEQGELVLAAIQRFVDNQGEAPFADFRSWVWSTDVLDDDTAFAADEAAHQYREWVREQRDQTAVTEDFLAWIQEESDTDTEITMSKDNDNDTESEEEEKSLAEQNAEAIDDLTDTVKDLTEELSDDGEGGSEKSADADGGDGGEEGEGDEKSQAEKNAEAINELANSVKSLAEASGHSQQLDYDGETEKDADEQPDEGEVKKAFLGL